MRRVTVFVFSLFLVPTVWAQGADRMKSDIGPKTVIGVTNPDLQDGAHALLRGDGELGVALTLKALKVAKGVREEEAALSNLCAAIFCSTNSMRH